MDPKPQPCQLGHRIAGFGNALLYVDTEGRLILRRHMLAFVFLIRDDPQQLSIFRLGGIKRGVFRNGG